MVIPVTTPSVTVAVAIGGVVQVPPDIVTIGGVAGVYPEPPSVIVVDIALALHPRVAVAVLCVGDTVTVIGSETKTSQRA